MSNGVQQVTWQQWLDLAGRSNYLDVNRLTQEAHNIRKRHPDAIPHIYQDPLRGNFLIIKGTLIGQLHDGTPAVEYVLTLTKQYPLAYPIVTIELPPGSSGFAIRPHPNVGTDGTCFLTTTSRWQPKGYALIDCIVELHALLTQPGAHPFERRSQPVPPQPPQQQRPPQQQQQPPQQQHQRPPQQPAPQQQYQPPPMQQNQPQHITPENYYQQQHAPHNIPPRQQATPPPAAIADADKAWASMLTAIFTIGEEELSQGGTSFNTPEERWRCIDKWAFKAVSAALSRRKGDTSGVELSSGHILTEDQVRQSPELHQLYKLSIEAQRTGNAGDMQRVVAAFMQVPRFRDRMAHSSGLLAEMYCPPALSMERVWASFFSSAFQVGEEALRRGDLRASDVQDQEPWLYMGLTAATAFNTVLASPPNGPMKIAFGNQEISHSNIPPEGAALLDAFLQLRDAVTNARLSAEDISQIRRKALWSDRSDRSVEVAPHLARIVAGLNGIASRASQEPMFKRNFQQTLELLIAVA